MTQRVYGGVPVSKAFSAPRRAPRVAIASGQAVILIHPDDYSDFLKEQAAFNLGSSAAGPLTRHIDDELDKHYAACNSQSSMTNSKHMSEQQDIIELTEDLVSLERAIMAENMSEKAAKFVSVEGLHKGNSLGNVSIFENEKLALVGIDIESPSGNLLYVVRPVLDEGAELAVTEADVMLLKPFDLSKVFPEMYGRVGQLIVEHTSFASYASLHANVTTRIARKQVLQDTMRKYLAEGRRATLEELHEAEEDSAGAFYAAKDDYGMF